MARGEARGAGRRGGRGGGGAAGVDPALPRALEEQWEAIADHVDGLPDEAFAAPSTLPGWSTAELVLHIAHSALALSAALHPGPVAGTVRDLAAGQAPAAVRAALRGAVTAAASDLSGLSPAEITDRLVTTADGRVRLGEFLSTRAVEAVVHGLDLGVPPARPALKAVVRLFTSMLAQRAPGHAVELRVPPFSAVQIVEGPRHTRGTPPNVVEADPAAFILVATGRLAWGTALADGRIRASGERADLRFLLPLLA